MAGMVEMVGGRYLRVVREGGEHARSGEHSPIVRLGVHATNTDALLKAHDLRRIEDG